MKENKTARIELRVKSADKEKIVRLADKCGLSISEYITQRALGYAPRVLTPEIFYDFYRELCQFANISEGNFSIETEAEILMLIDDIRDELLLPKKESGVNWQRQASGR